MRVIYLTTKNAGEAKKIANKLLQKKLVACANIFPIESMYWWEGEIQEDIEYALLLKTVNENFDKVEKEIKNMHEYDIPSVYSWLPDRVSSNYDNWIKKEIK